MVAAGITSILNFAPTVLQVPRHISLRKVDLSIELQILSFYEQRKVAKESVLRGTTRRRLAEVERTAEPGR
jgi:redox-sensing transcriptional repressor